MPPEGEAEEQQALEVSLRNEDPQGVPKDVRGTAPLEGGEDAMSEKRPDRLIIPTMRRDHQVGEVMEFDGEIYVVDEIRIGDPFSQLVVVRPWMIGIPIGRGSQSMEPSK